MSCLPSLTAHGPVNTAGQLVRPLLVLWPWYMISHQYCVHASHALLPMLPVHGSWTSCCCSTSSCTTSQDAMPQTSSSSFSSYAGLKLPHPVAVSGGCGCWSSFRPQCLLVAASVPHRTLKLASTSILLDVRSVLWRSNIRAARLYNPKFPRFSSKISLPDLGMSV